MDLQISTNELFQLEIQILELCKPCSRVKLQSTENRLKFSTGELDGPCTQRSVHWTVQGPMSR